MKYSITGVCLVLFIVILSQRARAQSLDTLRARYDNEALHFYKSYVAKGQNGKRIRLRELKHEFELAPESLQYFNSYRKRRTTAIVVSGTSLGCFVAGAIISNNGNKNIGIALKITSLYLDLFAVVSMFVAEKKLHRAVWLRNRNILFSPN